MTWLIATAQWKGHDYSPAGLQHGKTYDLRYAFDGHKVLIRFSTENGAAEREYDSMARFTKDWRVQPKR